MPCFYIMPKIREGMDMGIVNPATSVLYTDIPTDILEQIEDVVLNRRPDAAERLIELAEHTKVKEQQKRCGGVVETHSSALAWREGKKL